MKHHRRLMMFIVSLFSLILTTWIVAAQPGEPAPTIVYHYEKGQAAFVSANTSAPLALPNPGTSTLSSADKAQALLNSYAPLFGVSNPAQDLQLKYELLPDAGTVTRRYQQTYNGVPVFGGELIVNMTTSGSLLSVNGEASPNLSISTAPQLAAASAQQTALQAIAKWYGLSTADLVASVPSLWIYDARLLKPSSLPVKLVWRVDVTPVQALPLQELVLVDASTGAIALNFNQVDTIRGFTSPADMQQMNVALKQDAQAVAQQLDSNPRVPGVADLATYTANNTTTLPGTLLCDETQLNCTNGSNADADGAHKYAKEAYDLYWIQHNRDSINGEGMQIKSSVKYANADCNAFWSGNLGQMVYHNSCFLAVDDVVGHELTHGVTQFTSGLFYYYQSGALNESLSDVWGEALDQLNTSGDDSASAKWEIGEDTSIGALRFMDNPPDDGISPDRVQSPDYWKNATDQGGVHINSGINNKAVYLMVDGGSFNGRTVTGIGFVKVLKIYYRAQTTMLVSGSDFNDLYNALNQSCNALVGTAGITANDCVQVKTAAEAVELNLLPTNSFMYDAPVCPVGQSPAYLFNDNREAQANNYVSGAITGANAWTPNDSGYAHSGDRMIYGTDAASITDSVIAMNTSIALPAGAYLHFDHAFQFEADGFDSYDGGILEYSTNGGTSWSNASALFNVGQDYTDTLETGSGNPLAGQEAFTGESHGYISSRYNLASLAGQSIRFRWRIATDESAGAIGWVIDDIKIYTCGTGTTPTNTPQGPTPTSTPNGTTTIELLVNGGFEAAGETDKLAAAWSGKSLTSDQKRKGNKAGKDPVAHQGSFAFQFKTTAGVSSALQQNATVDGLPGDKLLLSAWITGKKLDGGGRVQAKVKYTNDTKSTLNLDIPTGTYAYTRMSDEVTLTGTVAKIKVQIKTAAGGKYYIDTVSLLYTTNLRGATLDLPIGQ
jgi:bacillolysin